MTICFRVYRFQGISHCCSQVSVNFRKLQTVSVSFQTSCKKEFGVEPIFLEQLF